MRFIRSLPAAYPLTVKVYVTTVRSQDVKEQQTAEDKDYCNNFYWPAIYVHRLPVTAQIALPQYEGTHIAQGLLINLHAPLQAGCSNMQWYCHEEYR